jgi:catechol 2,3-dioxygenase
MTSGGTREGSAPEHVKRASHVSIAVSDMERSIAFYRDVLGWKQVFDTRLDPKALEELVGVPGASGRACGGVLGGLRVELMCLDYLPRTPPAPGLGLRVLSLEVDDADAAYRAVRQHGAATLSSPVDVHGTRMFFLLDPDGQGIEMCQYLPGGSGWEGETGGPDRH